MKKKSFVPKNRLIDQVFRRPSNKPLVAPSLLAADFSFLSKEIKSAEQAGADLFHLDVMDGHFVPNITFGPLLIAAVRRLTSLPLDVHLMITNPDRHLAAFRKAGADLITVHQEAVPHLPHTISAIKKLGAKAGCSISPSTPFFLLKDILPHLDLLLLMSVNPGFGGQKFIPAVLKKVAKAKQARIDSGYHYVIEIDGGMNSQTAQQAIAAGAEIIVAGQAIFGSNNYRKAIRELRGKA